MNTRPNGRLATGVPGLDEVLHGGLIPGRAYLVSGGPGSGKTVLGLHFLLEGIRTEQQCLYVSLEESEERIRQNAGSLGLDLSGLRFLDLSPSSEFFRESQGYDLFYPGEVEGEALGRSLISAMRDCKAERVFVDSLTQFRFLTGDPYQFRKQVLSFLRFLSEQACTVLLSSESAASESDADLQFITDGVIELDSSPEGRDLTVIKLRGSGYRRGSHSVRLKDDGMTVYPRLTPDVFGGEFTREPLPSGVAGLDRLLNGGLERGTVTMLGGPDGTGKTTVGLQFVREAAARGERSVVYTFEEEVETLQRRSDQVGVAVSDMVKAGHLSVVQVEPLRFTVNEFASLVREEVEGRQARIVVIDSLAGFRLSFSDSDMESHLYTLCKYLRNMGATTILVGEPGYAQDSRPGAHPAIGYIADNIMSLSRVRLEGERRTAVGVVKKRLSTFDAELHAIAISTDGVEVGERIVDRRASCGQAPDPGAAPGPAHRRSDAAVEGDGGPR